MTADEAATTTRPIAGPRSRGLGLTIVLWSCGWTILIGAIGGVFAWGDIHDAHFRAELAVRGIRATAIVTDQPCGKGGNPKFHFAARHGDDCAAEDYMPRFIEQNPPGSRVDIAVMPGHPRLFVIAPGGMVPQRDVTGIWHRWLRQTLVMLAIYLPATAAILWMRQRRKRGDRVPAIVP